MIYTYTHTHTYRFLDWLVTSPLWLSFDQCLPSVVAAFCCRQMRPAFFFLHNFAFAALQGFLTPPKGDFPRGLATKGVASLHLDARRGDANRFVHRHMVSESFGAATWHPKILDETQRRAVFRRNFLAPVVACFSIWDLCLWVDDGGRFLFGFPCFKCFLQPKRFKKTRGQWHSVTKSSWWALGLRDFPVLVRMQTMTHSSRSIITCSYKTCSFKQENQLKQNISTHRISARPIWHNLTNPCVFRRFFIGFHSC